MDGTEWNSLRQANAPAKNNKKSQIKYTTHLFKKDPRASEGRGPQGLKFWRREILSEVS